jgi:hypothetical protein
MMLKARLYEATGALAEAGIRLWVQLTGKRVARETATWLECPMGSPGRIGQEFYAQLAQQESLQIEASDDAGLLDDFNALRGSQFNPALVHPGIRDFYERTSCYRMEAWSEVGLLSRLFLWFLITFVSRRMDQLNFPVSSLELAGGMTSGVLPMVRTSTGARVYTGWLRRLASDGRVIYAGLYSIGRPANFPDPCVKVSFPVPLGSATVFLRPEALPDRSFRLISSGSGFGEPGFYRMIDSGPEHWTVRYIRTLREFFHVYVDREGTLRTEHRVCFLGLTVLRLHYRMERIVDGSAGRPERVQTSA